MSTLNGNGRRKRQNHTNKYETGYLASEQAAQPSKPLHIGAPSKQKRLSPPIG